MHLIKVLDLCSFIQITMLFIIYFVNVHFYVNKILKERKYGLFFLSLTIKSLNKKSKFKLITYWYWTRLIKQCFLFKLIKLCWLENIVWDQFIAIVNNNQFLYIWQWIQIICEHNSENLTANANIDTWETYRGRD